MMMTRGEIKTEEGTHQAQECANQKKRNLQVEERPKLKKKKDMSKEELDSMRDFVNDGCGVREISSRLGCEPRVISDFKYKNKSDLIASSLKIQTLRTKEAEAKKQEAEEKTKRAEVMSWGKVTSRAHEAIVQTSETWAQNSPCM